ncbi:MAG: signal peptidase I [Rhizomicrobium sp.]|jgi:signal peptidase I
MIRAFKTRRPWAAALINFIFDPFFGMLYLNRGYIAIAYFAAELIAIAGLAFANPSIYSTRFASLALIYLPFRLVGAVHAFFLARKRLPGERMHWYSHWYSLVAIYVFLLALPIGVRTYLYQPFNLPSTSMSPTLNVGDCIFVKKFAYAGSSPHRGDIIVFNTRADGQTIPYVKRIVGLPGDSVKLVSGEVLINGVPARLEKLGDVQIDCDLGACRNAPQYLETFPGSSAHRILQLSTDGPLDNTNAVTVPANSYFVLGDNRDSSNDSRGTLGFISARDILGKVVVKFVDGHAHRLVWQAIH